MHAPPKSLRIVVGRERGLCVRIDHDPRVLGIHIRSSTASPKTPARRLPAGFV